MFKIKQNVSRSDFKTSLQISGSGKSGQRREKERYFEKIASLQSGRDVDVEICGNQAHVELDDDKVNGGDIPKIVVPQTIPDQSSTDMDDGVWEFLFQKAELYHELGHVLFTDWPNFLKILETDVEYQKRMFKEWWNIVEDAAIEGFLCSRFSIADDLRVKNENLLKGGYDSDISVSGAFSIKLMEFKHSRGLAEEILNDSAVFSADELSKVEMGFSIIEDTVPEIIENGDPVERNKSFLDLYHKLTGLLPSGNFHEENLVEFIENGLEPEGSGSGSRIEIDGDEIEIESDLEIDSVESDIQQEIDSAVESEDEENEKLDSIEKWKKVVGGNEDREDDWQDVIEKKDKEEDEEYGTEIRYDAPGGENLFEDHRSEQKLEAKRQSTVLKRYLKPRLRENRRRGKKKSRNGTINPRSIHKAESGDPNIFHQRKNRSERDYAVAVILDRSHSMSSNYLSSQVSVLSEAERGAGSLTKCIEDLGIDVCQISMYGGDICIEKDFPEKTENIEYNMFSDMSTGGTPLTETLLLARERVQEWWGDPLIFVVTDGVPDDSEMYRKQLDRCNFPVLGIHVSSSDDTAGADSNDYHRLVECGEGEIQDSVQRLIKSVIV